MAWNDTYNSLNSTARSLYDRFSDYQSKGQWNQQSRTDGEGQKNNYWKAGSGSNSFILDDVDYKRYNEWYKQAQTERQQQEAEQAARLRAEQQAQAQRQQQEAAQRQQQEAAQRQQQEKQKTGSFYNLTTQRTPVTSSPIFSGSTSTGSASSNTSPNPNTTEIGKLMEWLAKETETRKAEAEASRKQLGDFYTKQTEAQAKALEEEKAARLAAEAERKTAAAKAEEEAAKTKRIRDHTTLKNSIEQERLDRKASRAKKRKASRGVMSSNISRINSGVSLFGSVT